MILFVSGRTDIVAFYTPWLINRLKDGYIDVRNPFNKHLVSRIYLKDVDAYLFCTKNPLPILNELEQFSKPILFHVTLTPYLEEIEPNVPKKTEILKGIKKLSKQLGKSHVVVRYDPIFISKRYSIEYHKLAFEKLCKELNGIVERIIISFLDEYKNVIKNKDILGYRHITNEEMKEIGLFFAKAAKENNLSVSTCYEENDLTEYGFIKEACLSREAAFKLTGKRFKKWNARKCQCAEMVDIGHYNTCHHRCKYCYANFDETAIEKNRKLHDVNSSLLIGQLEKEDVIKVRK